MELQERFASLLQAIGFSENDTAVRWNELKKAYTKKERHYHNITHLVEMIACYETYKNQLQFPNELLYSIFYHDIIYKSTRKDNELKSAVLAVGLLPDNTSINKQVIFDMILATKDHISKGVEDEKWLIDFDLRILAKDWEDYQVYYKQIRKEYSIYPDFLYNPGRKKALEDFLEKDFIYQTESFRELFEAKARENIKKEIKEL
ncbi:putative metal-dependent HD superfamily phosphohydrolase [Flavobacterium arsenatis]|uniref:Metal-dependent HD superfamily phosphohydrolase n=1 Tax=Flavobacterium arsenatis TaxID=1484332 RepID=A0ABU1TNH6_9FLAO|nr:hypothetical protein [Flavobacterium arsenatis]MDR6967490.1 putative metal-dependent HD superfamily phosphohydrolase [Flavobacterium arsenatis]